MLSRRSLVRVPLIASFALVAACKSDGIARDDIPEEYAAAFCDYLVNCPSANLGASVIRVILENSPNGTCENAFGRELGDIDRFDAQIEAGTIRYDGGAAADCLAGIRSSCFGPEGIGAIPACNEVYVGTVAIGSGCIVDEECAGDAYCDEAAPGTCGGVCAATASLGQACGGDDPECSNDLAEGVLACQTTAANPAAHCVLVHLATASAGQPCGQVDTDGDDQTYATCEADLYCRFAEPDDAIGTCAEPLADLATCVSGIDVCADGGICLPTASGARCTTVTVQNTADTACTELTEPSGPYCNPLLRLECANGVCQEIGNGTAGANCREAYASDCDAGLYCNTTGIAVTGVCATLIVNGGACDPEESNSGCASNFCEFDGLNETCAEQPICE